MSETLNNFVNSDSFKNSVRTIIREEIGSMKAPTTKPRKSSKPSEKKEISYKAVNCAIKGIKVYSANGKNPNSSLRIWFEEKPKSNVLNKLKASGFRYFEPTKEWYAHNIERNLETAREIYKLYK